MIQPLLPFIRPLSRYLTEPLGGEEHQSMSIVISL